MPTATAAKGRGIKHLALRHETAFGTAPSGNYVALRYYSNSIEQRRSLTDNPILGVDVENQRDPTEFEEGLPIVSGDITVPVGEVEIGYWLSLMFGQPVTTEDDDDYVHVWTSGAEILPTAHLEEQRRVGAFKVITGLAVNQFAITADKQGGDLRATFSCLAREEKAPAGSTIAGTLVRPAGLVMARAVSTVLVASAAAGRVLSASLTATNNIEAAAYLDGSPFVSDMLAGAASYSGSVRARYADETWPGYGRNKTEQALKLRWQTTPTRYLEINLPATRVEERSTPVSGPGFEDLDFNFMSRQGAANSAMTVTLMNGHASYAMPA